MVGRMFVIPPLSGSVCIKKSMCAEKYCLLSFQSALSMTSCSYDWNVSAHLNDVTYCKPLMATESSTSRSNLTAWASFLVSVVPVH